jgi:hypothetical protein
VFRTYTLSFASTFPASCCPSTTTTLIVWSRPRFLLDPLCIRLSLVHQLAHFVNDHSLSRVGATDFVPLLYNGAGKLSRNTSFFKLRRVPVGLVPKLVA